MKIGILGSGVVGRTLAQGFLSRGDDVCLGSRNPAALTEWNQEHDNTIRLGSVRDAAHFGEIIVLAVKGTIARDVLETVEKESLNGKIIIDVTNPISDDAPENGVLKFFTSPNSSLMEQLQTAFPDAFFVKAFNSVGNEFMVNPDFGGPVPTMFICGNDAGAKQEVTELVEHFGFEAEDMGGVEAARAIEPLCMLWCIPGFLRNEWSHAFKLLKKI